MRASTSILYIAIGSALAWAVVAGANWSRPETMRDRNPLGDSLPSLTLQTPDGRLQSLRERLGHRPAVIYVFNQAECLGCSDLPLEFRVIRREMPDVQPLLIGSGAGPAAFSGALHDMHLEDAALIDEKRSLLKALGVSSEPLVILVGPTGRILLVDSRNTSRAARFPMGQVIHDLRSLFASHQHQTDSSSLGGR